MVNYIVNNYILKNGIVNNSNLINCIVIDNLAVDYSAVDFVVAVAVVGVGGGVCATGVTGPAGGCGGGVEQDRQQAVPKQEDGQEGCA